MKTMIKTTIAAAMFFGMTWAKTESDNGEFYYDFQTELSVDCNGGSAEVFLTTATTDAAITTALGAATVDGISCEIDTDAKFWDLSIAADRYLRFGTTIFETDAGERDLRLLVVFEGATVSGSWAGAVLNTVDGITGTANALLGDGTENALSSVPAGANPMVTIGSVASVIGTAGDDRFTNSGHITANFTIKAGMVGSWPAVEEGRYTSNLTVEATSTVP